MAEDRLQRAPAIKSLLLVGDLRRATVMAVSRTRNLKRKQVVALEKDFVQKVEAVNPPSLQMRYQKWIGKVLLAIIVLICSRIIRNFPSFLKILQ